MKTEKKLVEKIGEDFIAIKEEIQNPRLKIISIENYMTKEELESDINERNFEDSELLCTVVHCYLAAIKKTLRATVEVTSDTYTHMKKQNILWLSVLQGV